jgi:ribonuclease P protein component
VLAKENRLKKKTDFDFVFNKGKGLKKDFLFLKSVKNNLSITRFGFIVSKKVSNRAVVRNKARRRMSKVAQENLPKIKKGMDIVIVAGPQIKDKEFKEIKEKQEDLFLKSGLIKE